MNTNCTKCNRPMKPMQKPSGNSPINQIKMLITGYLCDCGHFNDFRGRKGFKEYKKEHFGS